MNITEQNVLYHVPYSRTIFFVHVQDEKVRHDFNSVSQAALCAGKYAKKNRGKTVTVYKEDIAINDEVLESRPIITFHGKYCRFN